MDPSLMLRLVPAFAAAVLVGMAVHGRRAVGEVADEVLRVLVVGLVAGRVGWLLLGGPDVWRNAVTTAILVRAGVLTGVGVLAAGWWVARRRDGDRWWRVHAAMPMALAGVAAWQVSCQVEGVCGGVPVSWGLLLPGRAAPAFPASYVEGALAGVLAIGAWVAVRGRRPSRAWAFGATYAGLRVVIGFGRPSLGGTVSVDQVLFVLVGVAAGLVAWRLRTVDGLAVEVGDGGGPVALVAHGVGSSALFVREAFAEPLATAGWRLAAMDLRGHADSAPAPRPEQHRLERHAADLAAVARWTGAEVVGGVSLGGMAAVAAAVPGGPGIARVRAVVAIIPAWSGRSVAGQGVHAFVAREVRRDGVDHVIGRLEGEEEMPSWIREVVLRDYRRHDPASLAAALQALDGGDAPTLDQIAELGVPLVVVGWRDDPGHPFDVATAWADAASSSTLVETSIAAMEEDRQAFGACMVEGLTVVDVRPTEAG